MVSEYRSKDLQRTPHDGSRPVCLLDLLGELNIIDVTDRIRAATEKLY